MYISLFLLQATLLGLCGAAYVLETSYTSSNWYDQFSFFTGTDPTAGYVNYVDKATATANGYIGTENGLVYMGVDTTNVINGTGRNSVRVTSNAAFNYGLFALDVQHMPGGLCGTWPAYWMLGPTWPTTGEIDIVEGVNDNANNAMTLHTSNNCSIGDENDFTGTMTTPNCYINAPGQPSNAGCDIQDQSTLSYGTDFNSNGGGVFVTEWTSSDILMWFFPRGTTPPDLEAGNPDPTSWKAPVAQFLGDCNIPSHFVDLQIVLNTDFCGVYAGANWKYSAYCSALADTCNDYVATHGAVFQEAYWLIAGLDVYEAKGNASRPRPLPAVAGGKNETAPLVGVPPLAMGGPPAMAPSRRMMGRGREMGKRGAWEGGAW